MPGSEAIATIFVFPGIYGDEPSLVTFRHACAPQLNLTLLELPDVDEAATVLRDVRQTGRHLAERVGRLQPEGVLLLAGFSFGGTVAVEVALQLLASGRRVSLVALFDAVIVRGGDGRDDMGSSQWRQFLWAQLTPLIDWNWGRRLLMELAGRVAPGRRRWLRRRLLWSLRKRALNGWACRPLHVPVLLVVSDEFASTTLSSWLGYFPDVEIVRVPGGHLDLMKDPAVSIMRRALLARVKAVTRRSTQSMPD